MGGLGGVGGGGGGGWGKRICSPANYTAVIKSLSEIETPLFVLYVFVFSKANIYIFIVQ